MGDHGVGDQSSGTHTSSLPSWSARAWCTASPGACRQHCLSIFHVQMFKASTGRLQPNRCSHPSYRKHWSSTRLATKARQLVHLAARTGDLHEQIWGLCPSPFQCCHKGVSKHVFGGVGVGGKASIVPET